MVSCLAGNPFVDPVVVAAAVSIYPKDTRNAAHASSFAQVIDVQLLIEQTI